MNNKIEQPVNETKDDNVKLNIDTFQVERILRGENNPSDNISLKTDLASDKDGVENKSVSKINSNEKDEFNANDLKNNIDISETDSNLTTHEGSIIGKFKDAKTLLEAYNNLQSEFTRKSQRLAILEKQLEDNKIINNSESSVIEVKNETNTQNKLNNFSNDYSLKDNLNKDITSEVASVKNETIDDFVSRNSDSEKYKKMLTEIAGSDALSNLPNKYQLAYDVIKVAESKIAEKLNDPTFVDKLIADNEMVKSKVITNYLSNLNNHSAPSVMSGASPSVYFSPSSGAPKTIREAGELFSKMLK